MHTRAGGPATRASTPLKRTARAPAKTTPRRSTRSSPAPKPRPTPPSRRRASGRVKRAPERLSAPSGVVAKREAASARRAQSARKRARSTTTAAAVAAALDTGRRTRGRPKTPTRKTPVRKTPTKRRDHVGGRALVGKCIRIDWPCGDQSEDGEYTAMVYGYVEKTGRHKIFYYKTMESEICCEELNLMDGSRSWELDTAPSLREEDLLEGMRSQPDCDPAKFVGKRVRIFWPDKKMGKKKYHPCDAIVVDIISQSMFRLVYIEDDWVEDRDLVNSELKWELVQPQGEPLIAGLGDATAVASAPAPAPVDLNPIPAGLASTPPAATRSTTAVGAPDNCSTDTDNSEKDEPPSTAVAVPRGRVARASVVEPAPAPAVATRGRTRSAKNNANNNAKKSVQTQPALTQPALTQPALTQPVLTQPALTQPALTQPALMQPALMQPALMQPALMQPALTQPALTHPALQVGAQSAAVLAQATHFPLAPVAGPQSTAQAAALLANSSPLAAAAAMVDASGQPAPTTAAPVMPAVLAASHIAQSLAGITQAQMTDVPLFGSRVSLPGAAASSRPVHPGPVMTQPVALASTGPAPAAVLPGINAQSIAGMPPAPLTQHAHLQPGVPVGSMASYPGSVPLTSATSLPQAAVPQTAFVPNVGVSHAPIRGAMSALGTIPSQPAAPNGVAVPVANPNGFDSRSALPSAASLLDAGSKAANHHLPPR